MTMPSRAFKLASSEEGGGGACFKADCIMLVWPVTGHCSIISLLTRGQGCRHVANDLAAYEGGVALHL